VTRKTVEAHLGHIYLKLDIKRREQLAATLQR
jgi:DNA-binding CsgD family transcriptional regulator